MAEPRYGSTRVARVVDSDKFTVFLQLESEFDCYNATFSAEITSYQFSRKKKVSGVAREIGNDKMTNNLERAWIRDLHLRKAE